MSKNTVPASARRPDISVGGALILVLWQREFSSWPGWLYGVLWTLFGILLIAQIAHAILAKEISEEKWNEVFKR